MLPHGPGRPFPARGAAPPPAHCAAHSTTRRNALKLIIAAALPLATGPRRAHAAGPRDLEAGGKARVAEIVDGDTLRLADGRELRLVGLQAPKLPLGRPGFPTWPLAPEAKAALETLALDRELELFFGGARMDRHGRVLAHLLRSDGEWIQGAMLASGMARTYSFADNRALVSELLAREQVARAERRGIWALDWYRIRRPDETEADLDSFQLIEGRALGVAEQRANTYLNFGPDWRTDFTLVAGARARKLCADAGLALPALEGRHVRARGWIESFNGPMIEITHPEQIEVLEP